MHGLGQQRQSSLWHDPSLSQSLSGCCSKQCLNSQSCMGGASCCLRYNQPLGHLHQIQSVISKKISMANPALDIMEMNENFQCLMAATIIIPEVVQAMILLNVIPKEYNRVAQTTLQTMEQSKLMFNYIEMLSSWSTAG